MESTGETMDLERANRKRLAQLPARLQESVLARLDDGAPIADIAQMVVDMADVKAPLKDDDEERAEAAERDHILDIFARSTLLSLVEQARQDGEPLMTWQGAKIQRFLDIISAVSFPPGGRPRVNPAVMLAVLEDLMDTATVPECQPVFSNIERERDNLVKAKTNLALLRTFKKLLKRLSKTQDTVFSGRILMFMATIWSLSERSAANGPGAFNTAPEVGYSQDADVPADGSKVDKAFYQTFWSLQEHFRHPAPLASGPTLSKFLDALQVVLTYFSENTAGGTGRGPAQAEYDTTYLTSPKLLSLQLGDPNFRRHLLLQALFVLQWLRAERKNSKIAKPPPDVAAAAAERLASLETQSKQLLRGLPPHGARFADYVEHTLEREKNWLLWKFTPVPMTKPSKPNTPIPPGALQACPTIEKDPLTGSDALRPPGKRKAVRRVALGNEVLARVWNSTRGDPMAALRGAKRAYVPPFMDYMQRLADEMDPESGIEEEYRVTKSPVYEWRGLRLNARHNVAAFGDVARHGGDLAALLPKSMRPPAAAGKEEASQGGNENDLMQDDEDPGEGAAEESGPREGGETGEVETKGGGVGEADAKGGESGEGDAKEAAKAEEADVEKVERTSAEEAAKPEDADAVMVDRTSTAEEGAKGNICNCKKDISKCIHASESFIMHECISDAVMVDRTSTAEEGAKQEVKGAVSAEAALKEKAGDETGITGEGQAPGPQPMDVDSAAEKGGQEGPQEEIAEPAVDKMDEGPAPEGVKSEEEGLDARASETIEAVAAKGLVAEGAGQAVESIAVRRETEETGRSEEGAGEEAEGKGSSEQSEKAGTARGVAAPASPVVEEDRNVAREETETAPEGTARSKGDDVAPVEKSAGPATPSTAAAVSQADLAAEVSEAVTPEKASPPVESKGPTSPKVDKITPTTSAKAEEPASTTPKVEEEVTTTPQEKETASVSPEAEEQAPVAQVEAQGAEEEVTPDPPAAERGGRGRGRGRGKRKPEETMQELGARRVTRRRK